jgi:ubiquinone/menaquinone biosynthesis C-methylase UbiE
MAAVEDAVRAIYSAAFGREPRDDELRRVVEEAGAHGLRKVLVETVLSSEYLDVMCQNALEDHLWYVHNARLRLIKYVLPPADVILDIGGANGSLVEYGYPHRFSRLIITDIPQDDRIAELKSVDLNERWGKDPRVKVMLTRMSDLSEVDDASIDMVWAGQVVEHMAEEEYVRVLSEVFRVLKVGGLFCLDTPNAVMARIHSPDRLLHPEHIKEYTPSQMRTLLRDRFAIERELGLVPMPRSHESGRFSYEEMILNNCFDDDLERSYLMYFMCRRTKR